MTETMGELFSPRYEYPSDPDTVGKCLADATGLNLDIVLRLLELGANNNEIEEFSDFLHTTRQSADRYKLENLLAASRASRNGSW